MKLLNTLKLGLAAGLIALLAACGGSESPAGAAAGADPAKPLPEVPWGSPAVFVTPGQTSASFALNGCYFDDEAKDIEGNLYQAKLVITSSGDVSIMGTTSAEVSAVPETLFSMKFAEATLANWGVLGTVEAPTYSLYMMKLGRTPDDGGVQFGVNAQTFAEDIPEGIFAEDNQQGKEIYGCSLESPLALKTLINEARVAKHMTQGVTAVDDYFLGFDGEALPSSVEGDLIAWSFPPIEFIGEIPQTNFRFNSASGVLSTSTGTDTTAPMSTVSFALPSGASEQSGWYRESTCRNMQLYEFKEAKTLFVASGERPEDLIIATRYGDKLMPIPIFVLFEFVFNEDGPFEGIPDCIRPRFNYDNNEGR